MEDQPGKTILPHGDSDRILRCHYCNAKLGTYDDECLDVGAGNLSDAVTINCKRCGRGTDWRPRTPRRRR